MPRLDAKDALLVGTLVPLWLVCAGLFLREGLRGGFSYFPVPVWSAANAHAYPIVAGRFQLLGEQFPELIPGSRVLRVGDADMRGASAPSVYGQASQAAADGGGRFEIAFEHGGLLRSVEAKHQQWQPMWWADLLFTASLTAVALLLLLRAPGWHLRRPFFAASLVWSIALLDFEGGNARQAVASAAMVNVFFPLAFALTLSNAVHWIPPPARAPRWLAAVPWMLGGVLTTLFAIEYWLAPPIAHRTLRRLEDGVMASCLLFLLAVFTRLYGGATALERRRARWGFFGLYVAVLPFAVSLVLPLIGAPTELVRGLISISHVTALALPIGMLIGIVWYDAADVDRLLGATTAYTILGIAGVACWAALESSLAGWASGALSISSGAAEIAIAAALAILLIPTHRLLRSRIDVLFFPSHAELEEGVERLMREIAATPDGRVVIRLVGERMDALFRPESIAIYVRDGETFTPILASEGAEREPFSCTSPIAATLAGRHIPLVASRARGRGSRRSVAPFDAAALQALAAALVVPLHGASGLVAVVCLGDKRSGDIYTPTDVALLTAVGSRASQQLGRLGTDAPLREAPAV